MLVIGYIAVALYHWDMSWFLLMEDFSPESRVIGFIVGVIFFLMDFVGYLMIDEYMVDNHER